MHKGRELLATLGDLRTAPDDSPLQRVAVARCGETNQNGDFEELAGGGGKAPDPAAKLAAAAEAARDSLL